MAITETRLLHQITIDYKLDGSLRAIIMTDAILTRDDVGRDIVPPRLEAIAIDTDELARRLGESGAVLGQIATLRSERDAAVSARAEADEARAAVEQERDALLAQVRALRGTPQFTARRLLDVLAGSAEDMRRISAATAESPEAMALYQRLLTRPDNEPVAVDSPVFLAALAALRAAIGDDDRVAEIFRSVNIDVTADPIAYVDPSATQI